MPAGDEIPKISGISTNESIQRAEQAEAKELAKAAMRQIESEESLEQCAERDVLFNPRQMHKKFERLDQKLGRGEEPKKKETSKAEPAKKAAESLAGKLAESFSQRNPELQKKTLLMLLSYINPEDTPEQILEKLQGVYKDEYLADEAIDFLIEHGLVENVETRKTIRKKLIATKERFNAQFGRQIRAGRNISAQALAFSAQNLGSPTALRNLYRDITGNPREPFRLFEELTKKFQFSQMKNIIDFILHSLGSDMKAKGPSISRSELQRLFSETRSMQAILGVFRFFLGRSRMIKSQFNRADLVMPSRMSFELLAKLFMQLLQERYPSTDKVLKLAFPLGIAEEIAAQIIIFTQYRDGLRQISPKLFFSERHRQEMLMALMETLSDLEDELEDEEEEEEEEEDEDEEKGLPPIKDTIE